MLSSLWTTISLPPGTPQNNSHPCISIKYFVYLFLLYGCPLEMVTTTFHQAFSSSRTLKFLGNSLSRWLWAFSWKSPLLYGQTCFLHRQSWVTTKIIINQVVVFLLTKIRLYYLDLINFNFLCVCSWATACHDGCEHILANLPFSIGSPSLNQGYNQN